MSENPAEPRTVQEDAEALPTIPRVPAPPSDDVSAVPPPRAPEAPVEAPVAVPVAAVPVFAAPAPAGGQQDSAEKQVWYRAEPARPPAPHVQPQPVPPPTPVQAAPPSPPVQAAPPPQWASQPPQQQHWAPQPPPQQWAPSGPVPQLPVRSQGPSTGLLIGILVAVLVVGGGVGVLLWQKNSAGSNAAATFASPPDVPSDGGTQGGGTQNGVPQDGGTSDQGQSSLSEGAAAPTTVSPEQLEQQALAQLDDLRAPSLGRLPLDGRWVAQVASKSVGISDPLQTAQNGSHTFYATDILAESLAARQTVNDPSEVYVVWGTDFGKRSQAADGSPYWVTVVDAGFSSASDVTAWCQQAYSGLTQQQLTDTCVPRQLTPPHD